MRKEVPMFITVLSGLALIVSQYFGFGKALNLQEVLDNWQIISGGFAFLIGAFNLTRIHGQNIQRRRENWPYSLILLVCLWGYIALGLYETTDGPNFSWIYDGIVVPLGSTMYGSIAFYITTAAYRAFRVRTKEATVLTIAAIVVALGKASIGAALIDGWGGLQRWLFDTIVTGTYRGIKLGAFLGGLATAMRILLGLERAHMGGR